jgi:preprotein translocase subunit SecG
LLQWFVLFLQIVSTLLLVVLMAVQTDKAEQGGGGVMGLGAASGRTSGNINLPVGAERILKPLTAWAAFGFLASSILNAIPDKVLTIGHVLVVLVIYIIGMLFAGRIWAAITGALGR